MQVTFQVNLGSVAPHLGRSQYGAIVAYAMGLKGFHSVRAWRTMMEISLNLSDHPCQKGQSVEDLQQLIYDEIRALWEIDPIFCPCGCMAPIALQNCLRISEKMLINGLMPEEIRLFECGNQVEAEKRVRARTGKPLKEARAFLEACLKVNSDP